MSASTKCLCFLSPETGEKCILMSYLSLPFLPHASLMFLCEFIMPGLVSSSSRFDFKFYIPKLWMESPGYYLEEPLIFLIFIFTYSTLGGYSFSITVFSLQEKKPNHKAFFTFFSPSISFSPSLLCFLFQDCLCCS